MAVVGAGGVGDGQLVFTGHRVLFYEVIRVMEMTVVMAAQHYKHM